MTAPLRLRPPWVPTAQSGPSRTSAVTFGQYNLVSWALNSFGVPLDDFLPGVGLRLALEERRGADSPRFRTGWAGRLVTRTSVRAGSGTGRLGCQDSTYSKVILTDG